MTLPTPDAQSWRAQPQQAQPVPPVRSMPVSPVTPPPPSSSYAPSLSPQQQTALPQPVPQTAYNGLQAQRRSVDTAGNSWNLATGGLKTLTAKRELPPRVERRISDVPQGAMNSPRSYTFALVILACLVVMLISGGIILFIMLQP